MKAKDTVMKPQKMLEVMYSIPAREPGEDYSRLNEAMCDRQAEITFPAAIKEVVDYFFYDAGIVALMGCSTMAECKDKLPGWYSKLEEWGILIPAEKEEEADESK